MSNPWSSPGRTPPNFNFNSFPGLKGLPPGLAIGCVAAVALLLILMSAYFPIDEGERGVVLHMGAIAGEADPGLHFKMPIITTIQKISVQIQKESFIKTAEADARMQAYSRDQQPATIALSVNYHVTDASAVYAQYGSLAGMQARVINPKVFEQLKNVFGQFDAADAIQKRAALNADVYTAIKGAVQGPVVIDSVQ